MLRMEFDETPSGIVVRMEGRFVKQFAEHARMLIGKSNDPSRFIVNLSEVTYVDAVGEEVLIWLKEVGVRFTAESVYCRYICERLNLPMAEQRFRRRRAIWGTDRSRSSDDHTPAKRNVALSTFSFIEEH